MVNQDNREILEIYETLVRQRRYDEAERIEKIRKIPYTLLNSVISETIINGSRGLARKLVERFKHRGYDDNWLGKSKI